MTARRQVWKGVGIVAPAQALGQVMGLVRAVIIASVLWEKDVGIAALLAATLAFFELLSDVSTDKMLVQSPRGDDPLMQRTAQGVMLIRGAAQALAVAATAWPVAWFFEVPEAWWAFACVGFVPLIKGMVNLDPARRQREMKYTPSLIVDIAPTVIVTAVAYPLAVWLNSYAAVVILSIGQAIMSVALSHLLAQRRYGLALDRECLRSLSRFALPLLFNGMLIFATNQGDRAIVGAAYSVEILGVYYTASVLILAPVAMLAKTAVSIGLPMLSKAQEQPELFHKRYSMVIEGLSVAASLLGVLSMIAGGMLVALISKEKYGSAVEYTPYIGVMLAAWALRVGPTLAAMARGDTVNALATNVTRSLSLIGVLIVASLEMELRWVVVCGVAGEFAALVVSTVRLERKHGVPMGLTWRPTALVMLAVGASGLVIAEWGNQHTWATTIGMVAALCGGVMVAAALLCPTLRDELVRGCRAAWEQRGMLRTSASASR